LTAREFFLTIDGKKEALERDIRLSWEQTRTVSFWSIRSNPNLKQNALKDYKDLMRFDWEESKIDELKRFSEQTKGLFPEKIEFNG
jgi:hypothetical protein